MQSDFNTKQYWEKRLSKKFTIEGVGFSKLGKYYNYWLYKMRKIIFFRHIPSLNYNWNNIKVLDIGSLDHL